MQKIIVVGFFIFYHQFLISQLVVKIDTLPKADSLNIQNTNNARNVFFKRNPLQLVLSDSDLFLSNVLTGAERMNLYVDLLKNKRVGVFSNQTSIVRTKNTDKYIHLIDTLINIGINVVKVFVPEHGLFGVGDAGEHIKSTKDSTYNIDIVSLYGTKKNPTADDLKELDVLIFDIQDVGVRFYTYISSLQYLLEAAIKYNIQFLLLDRPNPNGFYVDGPVLNSKFKSFIGMQKIPIVYGMTIAEYAQMIYFEDWLNKIKTDSLESEFEMNENSEIVEKAFSFIIIPCKNYQHNIKYNLPIKPSPNLTTMQAIYLYPSLCLFEGTKTSVGRGTEKPFLIYGFPNYADTNFSFIPGSKTGAKKPLHLNLKCFGKDLSALRIDSLFKHNVVSNSLFTLNWLIDAYMQYDDKKNFFDLNFFHLLTGTLQIDRQIIANEKENVIRSFWKEDLDNFKKIRNKYLLYKDF